MLRVEAASLFFDSIRQKDLQPLRDTRCSLQGRVHKSTLNVCFLSASVLIYPNEITVCPDIT